MSQIYKRPESHSSGLLDTGARDSSHTTEYLAEDDHRLLGRSSLSHAGPSALRQVMHISGEGCREQLRSRQVAGPGLIAMATLSTKQVIQADTAIQDEIDVATVHHDEWSRLAVRS